MNKPLQPRASKMKQHLTLLSLLLITSMGCSSNEACRYPEGTVKKNILAQQKVASSNWKTGVDKDSDEHLTQLTLVFTNGDIAVIEHKHCAMYNFELSYLHSSQSKKITTDSLAKLISELFDYAAIQIEFSPSLEKTLSSELTNNKFSPSSELSIGLPDDKALAEENIEYSISYTSALESNIFYGITSFYFAIGGQ